MGGVQAYDKNLPSALCLLPSVDIGDTVTIDQMEEMSLADVLLSAIED